MNKLSTQVTVLNATKARNLLIAKKRILLEPDRLKDAIDLCDITVLPPECAELLLKFPPTLDEVICFITTIYTAYLCVPFLS